jgi:hypothetical protein
MSGLRAVSFRDIRSSSELAVPSSSLSHSPRAKTLPASQLSETLSEFNLSRSTSFPSTPAYVSGSTSVTPAPSPLTPSRKSSLSLGPSTALLLEENSKLLKDVAKLRLFAQETDSLNRENQIEIQFLVEGKQRLLQENKKYKERLSESVARVEELTKKLAESERRGRGGRGRGRAAHPSAPEEEEDEREVREEILLTKIRLEEENAELRGSYERLEREHLKLKRRVEEGGGAALSPPPPSASVQQEINSLRETIRCRDLQISLLCLPQTASQALHQIVLTSSVEQSPLPPPPSSLAALSTVTDDLVAPDSSRDSLDLTRELSQLTADSSLLSHAAPLPPLVSSAQISPELRDCLVQDMSEVVADLIASKLHIASLSTQLDVEAMKQRLLKTRLGKYATRVSQLEVENISLCSRISALQPDRRGSWYPSWLQRYLD